MTGKSCEAERERLMKLIDSLCDDAEDIGYGGQSLLPSLYLLQEIDINHGASAAQAINHLGLLFSSHAAYRQGVNINELPDDYLDPSGERVNEFAWRMFVFAEEHLDATIDRGLFTPVLFDVSYPPLSPELIERIDDPPPRYEVEQFLPTRE